MTTPRSSLSRTVRFGLVCAAAWLAMVASLAPPAAAQSPTPPLTELVAAPGSAPQSVDLRWQTPLFEPDSAGGARVECTYDFRYSGAYITEQNFTAGLPVTGAIPDVVWVGLLDVQLDLNVSAENNSGYPVYTVTWDRPYLRAWLYVGADVPWQYGAVGKGLKDEAIKFTITKDSNPQWSIGTTVYTDNHGYAEWKPGDICDNAAGEWFTFEAEWNQHAVELRNGAVVQAVEGAEDTQRLILYDATDVVSPPYNMNEGGGELAWDQSSWITAFFPANATDEDVEISCSEPLAPPPPDGMPPGVPGAMVAFEITKSNGPQLLLPVEIRVQYPPEKLLE